jgi:hypothetical protein
MTLSHVHECEASGVSVSTERYLMLGQTTDDIQQILVPGGRATLKDI